MDLNFPINEPYKSNIVDAITINRSGSWWSAALLIKNTKTEKNFIALYKFQKRNAEWKVHQKLHINSLKDAEKYISSITELLHKL